MKRLLQSVALLLALLVSAQPMLADSHCAPQLCGGGQSTADCCSHSDSMSMQSSAKQSMGSDCGTKRGSALAGNDCSYDPYCLASTGTAPQLAPPQALTAAGGLLSVPPSAPIAVPAVIRVTGMPPGDAGGQSTARYILFHNFRI